LVSTGFFSCKTSTKFLAFSPNWHMKSCIRKRHKAFSALTPTSARHSCPEWTQPYGLLISPNYGKASCKRSFGRQSRIKSRAHSGCNLFQDQETVLSSYAATRPQALTHSRPSSLPQHETILPPASSETSHQSPPTLPYALLSQ